MNKSEASLLALQDKILGAVLTPGNDGYDEARRTWNLAITHDPAVIIVAQSASDIIAAVRFAKSLDLKIAVQATGHGPTLPANQCMLIVTSAMIGVSVDVDSKTAWIEAGAKWGKVLSLAQAAGLTPLLGSSSDVGAIGYTVGGGLGWLSRKYGLSVDSVNFFELVTVDGVLLRASQVENSDLFWGLCGGGGNLGVITGMEIQLYPVKTVFGGNLIYPSEAAQEVFTRYKEWIASAGDELTSSIALANFPILPIVPEFLQGKSVVLVRGCYCGSVEEGKALLQPWLDWMSPIANLWREMTFEEVDTISNDPKDPMPFLVTNVILRELTTEVGDILIRSTFSTQEPSPLLFAEIRQAGGAIAQVDQDANAYSQRDASLILQMVGIIPSPEMRHSLMNVTGEVKKELQPYLSGGVYLNFLDGEEKWMHTKEAFSANALQKLTRLKHRYDPENRLCFGVNIPPA